MLFTLFYKEGTKTSLRIIRCYLDLLSDYVGQSTRPPASPHKLLPSLEMVTEARLGGSVG